MAEKTFVEAYLTWDVEIESVRKYIDYWCNHDTGKELYEFLGLSKSQFVKWLKRSCNELETVLNDCAEVPVCKICGAKMAVKTAVGIICKSNYQSNGICHDCQVEHCCSTNCLACEIGIYPNCEHLEMKKIYMEED